MTEKSGNAGIGQRVLIFGEDSNGDLRAFSVDEDGKISQSVGNIYENEKTMADNNATRFSTTSLKLKYAKIVVSTKAMVFGDASNQRFNVAADGYFELAKVDISTLYFKNAAAGENGKVNIIGVTE